MLSKHISKEQEEIKEKKEKARQSREHRAELKRIAMVGYVIPSEEDKETEKALKKIATKGGKQWILEITSSNCFIQCYIKKQEFNSFY